MTMMTMSCIVAFQRQAQWRFAEDELNLALFQWLHFFLRCKEALSDHDWAMSHFTENDMVINAQPTGNSCENAAPRAHGYMGSFCDALPHAIRRLDFDNTLQLKDMPCLAVWSCLYLLSSIDITNLFLSLDSYDQK